MELRPWQAEALSQAVSWLVEDGKDRHFLINVAPGAGKTIASCAIAAELMRREKIERVIVIAPRKEVVNQWADEYKAVIGKHMSKVTGVDGAISELELDICCTWSAVQGLLPELQAICRNYKTLIICDEHHHAAVEAAWGSSADSAFYDAKYVLVLTGTPIRSDGEKSIWLAYDDAGVINHSAEGTYTLTYGKAVDLGYCRPATFHRHEGKFTVVIDDEKVQVSGNHKAELPQELKRISALQTALDFYRLARIPQYEKDEATPKMDGYQATMIEFGIDKLRDLRLRMPDAGGLIIAPSIEVAEYMKKVIDYLEDEKSILVHSQVPNAETKINAFKNTNKKWLVSVAMVSEGVDIKRLRVLIYLPNALTELAFRQAIGRVVRTYGYDDDTRAYIIMPSFETFENFARRVEDEMSPSMRKEKEIKHKKCIQCFTEVLLNTKTCPECGYEFPIGGGGRGATKPCNECGALNSTGATFCHECGTSFDRDFIISLDEALRMGAIVRGMDIDEEEVRLAEEMASDFRRRALKSGDQNIIRLLKQLPDESYARCLSLMNESTNKK